MPNNSSVYAREGTAGHAVASMCLESGQDAIEYVGRTVEGVEIEEDVSEAVQVYLDTIRGDLAKFGGHLLIEQKFHLEHLHPDFWGTADAVLIGNDEVNPTLRVYDLKLGAGKIVEVVNKDGSPNIQASYYALGAVQKLPKGVFVKNVELIIVQPRAWHKDGPVRRHTVTLAELNAVGAVLVDAANKCDGPNPVYVVGDHCGFCAGAPTCKALRDFAMTTAQLDFDDETGIVPTRLGDQTLNPYTMTDAQLSHCLDAADVIDAWVSVVRSHAKFLADGGHGVIGWKLVDRQARRKWLDETAAAAALSLEYGLDESAIFKQKLLSPAQVEKQLPKSERAAIAVLYDKASSGTVLVRADNPRTEAKAKVTADFDDGVSTDEAADW